MNATVTYVAQRASVVKRERTERIKNRLFLVFAIPMTILLGYIMMWTGYLVTLEIL